MSINRDLKKSGFRLTEFRDTTKVIRLERETVITVSMTPLDERETPKLDGISRHSLPRPCQRFGKCNLLRGLKVSSTKTTVTVKDSTDQKDVSNFSILPHDVRRTEVLLRKITTESPRTV